MHNVKLQLDLQTAWPGESPCFKLELPQGIPPHSTAAGHQTFFHTQTSTRHMCTRVHLGRPHDRQAGCYCWCQFQLTCAMTSLSPLINPSMIRLRRYAVAKRANGTCGTCSGRSRGRRCVLTIDSAAVLQAPGKRCSTVAPQKHSICLADTQQANSHSLHAALASRAAVLLQLASHGSSFSLNLAP